MEKLIVESTKSSPYIEFDPNLHTLLIKGQSYPENAFKFYEPILSWIDEYLSLTSEEATLLVQLQLPYINTSSTKCLLMILEKFDKAFQSGKNIKVNWFYNSENESELECAEEFKEDLLLPFVLIPIEKSEGKL